MFGLAGVGAAARRDTAEAWRNGLPLAVLGV
jgi:hypothetical protein